MTELSTEIRRAMDKAFWNGFFCCGVVVTSAAAAVGLLAQILRSIR